MTSESNGDGTSRAMTEDKRDQVRKKIDALAASFRLLSNPIMRKQYVKSKLASPPKMPTTPSSLQSTPRSNSQKNSPSLTPSTPTTANLQSTPRSSGQMSSSQSVHFVGDEFDMIASRHYPTSSESASEFSRAESDEVQVQLPSHTTLNSTFIHRPPQIKTPVADNKRNVSDMLFTNNTPKSSPRGSISSKITIEESYAPTFRKLPQFHYPIQENEIAADSFDEILNGTSDEQVITKDEGVIVKRNPMNRKIETSKPRASNALRKDKNNIQDDSTVTTEYSEDLSYEHDRSKRMDHGYRGKRVNHSKNKKVYEEDDEDEYTYDEKHGQSESLDDYTTSYESSMYTSQTYGSRGADHSFDGHPVCCASEDVEESISDTISAFDRVFSVFSISENELDAFSHAIHRAEKGL